MTAQGPKKLSAGVLQMKFMSKTRKKMEDQEKKKRDQELRNEYISEASTADPIANGEGSKTQFCKDLTVLENLSFGRLSFKGCNPEVEKLMVYYERKRNGECSDSEEEDEEKEVSDVQMAQQLSGASGAMAKKFKSKSKKEDHETSSNRLNFDESTIRKRKSDSGWTAPAPKFQKPSD